MEVVQFVPQLGKALWDLKGKYDQHGDNKKETKELQLFIQDYNEHIPTLQERFKRGGGNAMGTAVLNILERDIVKATRTLEKWSADKAFFRILNSDERMRKLEHLHSKVMASVQKNLGIASLSALMDVRESQTTILNSVIDSNAQLKSLVTACIGSMAGTVVRVVKEEVLQARQMSFADEKFWEEVLAAVNQREAKAEAHYFYMDPILCELMIDPVVASNGHTYCRWRIIDNNVKKDPYNPSKDLTILVDNLTVRSKLFEEFPRLEEFSERREKFRHKALGYMSNEMFGDAAVALQHVLQWNKNDEECAIAFLQAEDELKRSGGASLSHNSSTCDSSSDDEFGMKKSMTNAVVEELVSKDYPQIRDGEPMEAKHNGIATDACSPSGSTDQKHVHPSVTKEDASDEKVWDIEATRLGVQRGRFRGWVFNPKGITVEDVSQSPYGSRDREHMQPFVTKEDTSNEKVLDNETTPAVVHTGSSMYSYFDPYPTITEGGRSRYSNVDPYPTITKGGSSMYSYFDPKEDTSNEKVLDNETTPAVVQTDSSMYSYFDPQEDTSNEKVLDNETTPAILQTDSSMLDRVLVEKILPPTRTAGGILLPEATVKLNSGTVIEVGPGVKNKEGNLVPLDVQKGDIVLLPEYGGSHVKLQGREYVLYRHDDLLGIFEQ